MLGVAPITDVSDTTVEAVSMVEIFEDTRDALLSMYIWKFSIKRVQITKNATAPVFGRTNAFDLPADYLAPLPPYPEDNRQDLDWIIENGQIITDNSSPLDFRYIAQITDVDDMHVLFKKTLSAMLAEETAEILTQSNSKQEYALKRKEFWLTEAKKHGACETVSVLQPTDSWVSAREGYFDDNTKTFYGS
jgi:hypothetical protein